VLHPTTVLPLQTTHHTVPGFPDGSPTMILALIPHMFWLRSAVVVCYHRFTQPPHTGVYVPHHGGQFYHIRRYTTHLWVGRWLRYRLHDSPHRTVELPPPVYTTVFTPHITAPPQVRSVHFLHVRSPRLGCYTPHVVPVPYVATVPPP